MKVYYNSLITTMIVCQIAVTISPNQESARKYVRFVCSLVLVFIMLSPIKSIISNIDAWSETFESFFTVGEIKDNIDIDTKKTAAESIMTMLCEKYKVNKEGLSVVFVTDESEFLVEIQVYIKNCPYSDREEIEKFLMNETGVDAYVFSE